MSNIINIEEKDGKQVVSARNLYFKLGLNPTHWSRWSKKNIEENQFAIEGIDYEGFFVYVEGNKTKDYALSVNFAEKICMLARTIAGEKIRQYFIEIEKKYRESINNSTTYIEGLKKLIAKEQAKQLLLQNNTYSEG